MRRSVLEGFPDADISVSVVWMHVLPDDTKAAARAAARTIDDPRVRHFDDPRQRSGAAITDRLEWAGRIAWDIYLFYGRDSRWTEVPPAAVDFMHQLIWEPSHFRTGDDLVKGLGDAIQMMLEKASG